MDQVTLVKNQYHLEQWTKLIQECQSSGMKVDDWCTANDVSHHAYYYWLYIVRYVRWTYKSPKCKPTDKRYIVKAPAPSSLMNHSLASPSSVAYVIYQKYSDYIPLYVNINFLSKNNVKKV